MDGSHKDGEEIRRLDHHQKGVNIAKAVGCAEGVIGSTLGIIGAGLLFSPLAPVGVIVGLVGLGIGTKGVAVEVGATIANVVIGKHAIKNFDEDMNVASINRQAMTKIWEKICKCAKEEENTSLKDKEELATAFIQEVQKWELPVYLELKQKYLRFNTSNDEKDGKKKWFEFWRNKEEEIRYQKKLADILDYIENFWFKKIIECLELQFLQSSHGKTPNQISNIQDPFEIGRALIKTGQITKDIGSIVNTSLRVTSGGVSALDEVAEGAVKVASTAVKSMDEVGTATGYVMKTVKSILTSPVFGVVTGSVGFIMSSIFLGVNIKSIIDGSKSEKTNALVLFMQQIDISFEMLENIEEALKKHLLICSKKGFTSSK